MRPRGKAVFIAGVMTLAALAALAMPAEAATQRALTISTSSAKPKVAFKAFDGNPLKVFDFDRDGDKEVVAQNDNRFVYVFDARSGRLLAELTTTYPSGWGARPIQGAEAAVLKKGQAPHLVVANSAAVVTAFRFDGVASDGKFKFTKAWERRLSDCHSNPSSDSRVAFADLDRDGALEILAETEEVGVYALRANGDVMWKRCISGGNGEPGVGDLDKDGWPDVVWPSDGGRITAMSGKTGSTRWSKGLGGAMPVGPTVAQLDGRGGADVLVGVRDKHDCSNYGNNHVVLWALSGTGAVLWKAQPGQGNPLSYTHPVVHDVDGDGRKDVLWADWNTQGHKCGNWERTGPANFYRLDAAGKVRWNTRLNTFWNNKDLAVADVDGDGTQEVLANGPNGGQDGIWYLSSRTGSKEAFVSTWPWKVTRGPVVEDMWGKGTAQWVISAYAYGSGSSGGAILVYDTGKPFRAAWPHTPYP